jgi:hypothetical protein
MSLLCDPGGITRFARDPHWGKQKMLLSEHFLLCDPEGIQTPNLLIRSQMLYSVKLRDPYSKRGQI